MIVQQILKLSILTLVMVWSVYSQEKNFTTKAAENRSHSKQIETQDTLDNTTPLKQPDETPVLISIGTNLSSFLGEEGDWQWGYSLGLIFNIHIYRKLSITIPLSYTRINAAPKNVESRTYPDFGEIIYKTLSNWQVSVVHLEVPLLLSYKFLSQNSYDIRYILGAGITIGLKDFSKIKKFTKTDEIIGIEQYGPPLEPQHSLNGGANIIAGIRFHVNRFYMDLLYKKYLYEVKDINRLNTISIKLGIDIL